MTRVNCTFSLPLIRFKDRENNHTVSVDEANNSINAETIIIPILSVAYFVSSTRSYAMYATKNSVKTMVGNTSFP
ncbi:MAG: hypothetical protein ACMXYL_02235 [Candidatus Woesearchaeota archaeon]